jgi:hypothetical protein
VKHVTLSHTCVKRACAIDIFGLLCLTCATCIYAFTLFIKCTLCGARASFSEHPMYAMAASSGEGGGSGGGAVTMDGIELTTEERGAIYATLLQHMTDEQRIAVTVSPDNLNSTSN